MNYLLVLILDVIFGDPNWLLHPVQAVGMLVNRLESFFRKRLIFISLKLRGLILVIIVVGAAYIVPYLVLNIPYINAFAWYYFAWTGISLNSLYKHSNRVLNELNNDLKAGQRALGMIVSRETNSLSETSVIKATVETVAENTSDGIIAPLFYLFIGGVPLMMIYKAVNTMDAMIGYKSDKYIDFGYFAAKLDDLMNLIPARITALLLIISSFFLGLDFKAALKTVFKDAKKHASPNAGYPESAVAGALNVQLGGDSYYHGKLYDKASLGVATREIEVEDIKKTQKMMIMTTLFAVALMSFFAL
ncbi:MAG: cobalamin biosynthesis protein CobD [Alkaliphilus sp.]|nr:cobalamin biosynthesis protein CobD [bacterium AH-315-E09]PHS30320.1 MAG: cobalamin biosynthesis protein CobD [Alkaliphilus sp.]